MTELPAQIGNLHALRVLSVSHNQLLNLPDSIGDLAALQELDATNNQLLVLPDSLMNACSLVDLHISGNQLQGRSHLPAPLGRDIAVSQRPPAVTPHQLRHAVAYWSVYTDVDRAEPLINAWYGYGREPLAKEFAQFVAALTNTKDFEIGAHHFAQEVIDMLDQLRRAPELRRECFKLVDDATTSCGDRTALAFNAVRKACICHKGKNGEYSATARRHRTRHVAARHPGANCCPQGRVPGGAAAGLY